MGLLSRVARVAGRVVSEVGGERGKRVVDSARAVRDRIRPGEAQEPSGPPPWPDAVAGVWDRGHDLLSNHWPIGTGLLRQGWGRVGGTVEEALGPVAGPEAAREVAAFWLESGEAFARVWEAAGASVADAWARALRAPDAVTAEGILDSAIQSGWRQIREAWGPVRLCCRERIPALGQRAGVDEERIRHAQAAVEAAWGHTETHLSDRFLDGGGYLVSLVREVAEGQSAAGELLDTLQHLLAQQEATWEEGLKEFDAAWREAGRALSPQA